MIRGNNEARKFCTTHMQTSDRDTYKRYTKDRTKYLSMLHTLSQLAGTGKNIEVELRIKSQRYHQTAEIRNKNYPQYTQDATGIMCKVQEDDTKSDNASCNHGNNFIFNDLKNSNQSAEVNHHSGGFCWRK